MIFNSKYVSPHDGFFRLSDATVAEAPAALDSAAIRTLWHGFTYRTGRLTLAPTDACVFRIGKTAPLPSEGEAWSIHVDADGVCVSASNERDLLHGLMGLLDRIRMEDVGEESVCVIDFCSIRETPLIGVRMVHYCIFPETTLWELRRFVRFSAALRYTHIVLEFWGMLQYDCMRELSWRQSYTKEQLRPILREARDLGLEVIPMFNHWGHAAASRVMHGKHVVLDQNPALQSYFSEDGWCWDIRRPKVRRLLRQIREELCELCGDGSYFHIGCDEAYNFEMTRENMDFLCDFINEISAEMRAEGRRVIAWGDMFLYNSPQYNPKNRYEANAPSPEVERYLLAHLSRDVLIADWQYHMKEGPVESAFVFRDAGFDALLCPWDRSEENLQACLDTTRRLGLVGLMHTTWHTLSKNLPYVTMAAVGCFEEREDYGKLQARTQTAALWRRVGFADGDYERAGWATYEIGVIT